MIDLHVLTERDWSLQSSRVVVEPFSQHVGPTVNIPESPLDIFSLIFTPAVIEYVVCETNRYAEQCLAGTNRVWTTNNQEMRAYLGFCILMGIVHEPEIRDYWSQSDLLHYSPIASRISRRRFEEISRYFHLVDNSTLPQRGQPGFSRLQKVQHVFDLVRKQFTMIYHPNAYISVDEAMIAFKGENYYTIVLHASVHVLHIYPRAVLKWQKLTCNAHVHRHAAL